MKANIRSLMTELKSLTIADSLRIYHQPEPPMCHLLPETQDPSYEFVWDRVLRMKKENHPLIAGGHCHSVPVTYIKAPSTQTLTTARPTYVRED